MSGSEDRRGTPGMCADGDRTLRAALVRRIRRGILAASAALSLLVLPACGSAASTRSADVEDAALDAQES